MAFHYHHGSWNPIFAEQYFPHPGIHVSRRSPGAYPAAFSAIDAGAAAFVDLCSPCLSKTPMAIAIDGGAKLIRIGDVEGIQNATSASFLSPSEGWVAGTIYSGGKWESQIVHTADGGRTWHSQYRTPLTGTGP